MKKPELVALAEAHALKKTGKKDELIQRILAALPPAPAVFDLPDDDTILSIIEGLNGMKLAQRTPERVAHRRSDLIRKRTVFEAHTPLSRSTNTGSEKSNLPCVVNREPMSKKPFTGTAGAHNPRSQP